MTYYLDLELKVDYVEENGIGAAMRDLILPRNRRIRGFTTTQDSKTTIVRTLISDLEAGIIELPTKELRTRSL
jgi:hypothetical protein